MAEFKFFCPLCGQQILCDTGYSGTQIECPACHRNIIVPQTLDSAATVTRPEGTAKARVWRNVLLIAGSLVVLTGLVIGGWLAHSRITRVQSLRKHLPSGLLALWLGDGNLKDIASANNGTLVGHVGFGPGKVGQAFSFNGASGYVSIPDSPSLDAFANGITVAAWIKVNHLTANPDWEGIVTKGNASWRLLATAGAKTIYFSANGATPADIYGNRNVNDGKWHHVAGVYDGTKMLLYVDGRLDASRPASGSMISDNDPVCVGYIANTSLPGNYHFDGLINEASIYNRALTASEIQAIYDRQK
jgi:Concanavalin A-like lectin/glucanases superfamily